MSLAAERIHTNDAELALLLQFRGPQARFAVREQCVDKHLVIPDLHGEHRVLERIIDSYANDPDLGFVFLGDILDRKSPAEDTERGVFKTLELIRELGSRAVVTLANHEWLFHASSSASDQDVRGELTQEWLGMSPGTGIEQNVLVSYGMDPSRRDDLTLNELRKRMARAGHLGILTSATPYFETESFIATHAGLMPTVSWEVQRQYLAEVAREMDEGLFYDRPPQWFSMKLATSTKPIHHTDKTIVSGHAHILDRKRQKHEERSLHGGKRIRLASSLNAPTRAPAYVWQDWDQEIIAIPHPDIPDES